MPTLDHLLRWIGLGFELDLQADPFSRITPRLYVGERPTPDAVPALVAAGITHVVSCLPATERPAMAFLDDHLHTRFIALHDGIERDITAVFPTFFDAMAEAAEGRLLVHCQVGVSRSATLAIAHVMRSTDQRFWEAFVAVRACRPEVLPNIGFASQLQRLEHTRHPPRPPGEAASLTRYLHEVCKVPAEPHVLQDALAAHGFDAVAAVRALFDGEIPRVVQGARSR